MAHIVGRKQELIADTAVVANGDTLSSEFKLAEQDKGQYIELNVSNYVDGSYVATLQHSPDGTNWYDLTSTDSLTANGQTIKLEAIDTIMFKVRLKITASAVTSGATVSAKLHY